jgi:hypothetical protein
VFEIADRLDDPSAPHGIRIEDAWCNFLASLQYLSDSGRKAMRSRITAILGALALTVPGVALLTPASPASASSCVEAHSTPGEGAWVYNNCSYNVDIKIRWTSGRETACDWIRAKSGAFWNVNETYDYWVDCHGR